MRISYFVLCVLLFALHASCIHAGVTQNQLDSFRKWLDDKNPTMKDAKITFVPIEEDEEGYVGPFKVIADKEFKSGDLIYSFPFADLTLQAPKGPDYQKEEIEVDGKKVKFDFYFMDELIHLIYQKSLGEKSS
eukprot:TRINITY_DN34780_c0_g1_i1.p1 TRINITY_DN34780_c0_g1~~TRINITY_DN34780_c0_g1_i1.p1  ORF type:complete len:133 (-),score=14.68 TRINITY_DN34780_c0_g1_i1:4-402(-)